MTDTATLPLSFEIQKAHTGPGKFWVGDRLARAEAASTSAVAM